MTFFEHLEALRWHLIRSVIAIFIGAIIAFANGNFIFDTILLGPTQTDFWTYQRICDLSHWLYGADKICVQELQFSVQNLALTGQFFQHILISFMGGTAIALPYILYEVYRFVKPALKNSERKYSGLAIGSGSLLFFFGLLFGYFVIVPISINFLGNYTLSNVIENKFTVESIVKFVAMLSMGAGIMFELPLVIYFLAKAGLVGPAVLKKYRKIALVVILAISAIVTPPDIASQIILSVPIFMLYELGIFIAKKVEKNYDKD
ncbi:MAG: twin-arginine translocase subunit TatC [Bacteroidia bacterium]